MPGLSTATRWAFGTVDVAGYDRDRPIPAGVLLEHVDRSHGTGSHVELSARRLEAGDHASAIALELGVRAASYFEED